MTTERRNKLLFAVHACMVNDFKRILDHAEVRLGKLTDEDEDFLAELVGDVECFLFDKAEAE